MIDIPLNGPKLGSIAHTPLVKREDSRHFVGIFGKFLRSTPELGIRLVCFTCHKKEITWTQYGLNFPLFNRSIDLLAGMPVEVTLSEVEGTSYHVCAAAVRFLQLYGFQ
jgi:hypothetical protein